MEEKIEKINNLLYKLENLVKRQEAFSKEINEIREEIYRLRSGEADLITEMDRQQDIQPVIEKVTESGRNIHNDVLAENDPLTAEEKYPDYVSRTDTAHGVRSNIEKFIGENLINKIGIGITVLGVAIGTKYAIDHQLINPLTRIILGYLMGLGLLLFAVRLKKGYENFSSVLLSGSMSIMYFITFSAYSFYSLFPQVLSFVLMVLITVFTVSSAIKYSSQVIAHIGLVGAYAVPFLLREGSESVTILFIYTAIINTGILVISFKKYWKTLYYSSFLITWGMYLLWFISKYQASQHLVLAVTFLSIFFVTFYLMLLAYKLLQKVEFNVWDIVLLLSNSFILFGIGYNILTRSTSGENYLGLFTFCNAIIHFIVSLFIFRNKFSDRNLAYMISGLALIFFTISIPVQLNGNWVTLLWAGEAALLFWLGRTKSVKFYEVLSYFLMLLAFFSLLNDWVTSYNSYDPDIPGTRITPLVNINFLTSLLFVTSFGFIIFIHRNLKYQSRLSSRTDLMKVISFIISVCFFSSLYFTFSMEISNYWDQLYTDSLILSGGDENPTEYLNPDLPGYKTIWLINYSLFLFSMLSLINIRKLRDRHWGLVNLIINALVLIAFLIPGLYTLSELRESYINQPLAGYYTSGPFNIGIRYISFGFVGMMMITSFRYVRQEFLKPVSFNLGKAFDIVFYSSLIWIISSEMISWLDIIKYSQSYKIVLSILWGSCALIMTGIGIWKRKKHLRIAAIVLFGVTLIKLFLYDISHLDTISKTVVFVALGIILLTISFLYNKYREKIFSDNEG